MSTIVCRKCGGKHLTIKCGKEKKISENKPNQNKKPYQNKKLKNYNNSPRHKRYNRFDNSKKVCVRISNLPEDISVRELNELLQGWGNIGRINFNKSKFPSAFVDFYDKEEAEYFAEALNKTPFDNLVIHVEIIKSN